jgi:hypothetical protein
MYVFILALQDGVFVLSIGKECSESKDGILAKVAIFVLLGTHDIIIPLFNY